MAKLLKNSTPEVSKILFENNRVRVIELNVEKGTKAAEHTHPDYLAYAITSFGYIATKHGGKKEKRDLKASDVDWHEGETHTVEFTKSGRAIVVELK